MKNRVFALVLSSMIGISVVVSACTENQEPYYDAAANAIKQQEIRDEILESFGYHPEDYTYYHCSDITAVIPDDQYLDIRHQLRLSKGDSRPGFYVTTDRTTILAVNKNAREENQIFVFHQDPENTEKWIRE